MVSECGYFVYIDYIITFFIHQLFLFEYRLPYKQYFGGVSAMSKQQFQKINGFPNNYWGWGGEDDDIFNR